MHQFDRVLEENESILWTGKPRLGILLLSKSILLIPFIVFGVSLIIASLVSPAYQGESAADLQNRTVFIGLGSVCIAVVLAVFLKNIADLKKLAYAITNTRLLFQRSGSNGGFKIESIPFTEVKDMQLNQGIADMLFGGSSKSLLFSTADSYQYVRKYGWQHTPKRFEHVANAEQVLRYYQAQLPALDTTIDQEIGVSNITGQSSAVDKSTLIGVAAPTPNQSLFMPRQYASAIIDANAIPVSITQILKPGEQVLWQGKPQALPFILHYFPIYILMVIALGLSSWAFITNPEKFIQSINNDQAKLLLTYLVLIIVPFVYRLRVYNRIQYVVTDQRLLVQGGAIGMDIEAFEREQITSVAVTSSFLDHVFGGGSATVSVETFKRRLMAKKSIWWAGNELQHIKDAGIVQQILQPKQSNIVNDQTNAGFVPLVPPLVQK